jgi:hypothetical protein
MHLNSLFWLVSRPVGLALAGVAALAAVPVANASDNVYWSIGVNAAPGVSVGVSNARPVYVQPAPIYMHPQPVVVHSPPRYVMPSPVYSQPNVYYTPPPVFYGPPRVYYGPPRVHYGPPPLYYGQPQVVYGGPRHGHPPAHATGWVPPGHRHRHPNRHDGRRHND